MIAVKVYFAPDGMAPEGDSLTTRINATLAGAEKYYIGNQFNLGSTGDRLLTAVRVELLHAGSGITELVRRGVADGDARPDLFREVVSKIIGRDLEQFADNQERRKSEDALSSAIHEIITGELKRIGKRDCNTCDTPFPLDGRCPVCTAERVKLAGKLADELRELADACEKAATGDKDAKKLLKDHTEGHWRALCVGGRKVEELFNDAEDN